VSTALGASVCGVRAETGGLVGVGEVGGGVSVAVRVGRPVAVKDGVEVGGTAVSVLVGVRDAVAVRVADGVADGGIVCVGVAVNVRVGRNV
jgi:hypothetical protein